MSKIIRSLFILSLLLPMNMSYCAQTTFKGRSRLIPPTIKAQMQQHTWQPHCPISLNELRYLELTYWGFDNKSHQGTLIVNRAVAKEVLTIFKILYQHHFPIERMELMDTFEGDDERAMAANNTSAFNCRAVTGQPGLFSQHSYGRAIDINPRLNPYVKGTQIYPVNATPYVEQQPTPGKITKDSLIYQLFTQHGWDWGGHWYDVQDYQHFEKRANGEKRNPYGYETR